MHHGILFILAVNILILVVVTVGVWILTGYDKTWGGESLHGNHFGRLLRTGLVVFLVAIGMFLAECQGGYIGALYLMGAPFGVAMLLRSAIAEILAHGFLRMADPMLGNQGDFDPQKSQRYMQTVGHLIRTGQREQAIKLCEEFKRTGEVDRATLESTLEYLGVKQGAMRTRDPLMEARTMRAEGRFLDAEKSLMAIFGKKADNFEAGLLLIRLYMENLQQPAKAQEILRRLETQSHLNPALLDIARYTIEDGGKPRENDPAEGASHAPKTVDEALAQGGLGTAVKLLEAQIEQDPRAIAPRLKLMELQAVRCNNIPAAEKIVKQMETSGLFPPEQLEGARAQIKQWRRG